MKITPTKRSLCLLLAAILLFSLAPIALAEEDAAAPSPVVKPVTFDLSKIIPSLDNYDTYSDDAVTTNNISFLEAHAATQEDPTGYVTFKDNSEGNLVSLLSVKGFSVQTLTYPAISFSIKDSATDVTAKQELRLSYYDDNIFSNPAITVAGGANWTKYSLDLSGLESEFAPIIYSQGGSSAPMVKDFKVEQMTVAPVEMAVTDDVHVSLSCKTTGTTIYYTTDDSLPTADEAHKYTGPISLTSSDSIKITAFAVKDGTSSAVSIKSLSASSGIVPTASHPSGTVESGATVALGQPEGKTGFTIRYTIDGTEPTEKSAEYENPFLVTRDTLIRAKAFKDKYVGATVSFRYYIAGGDKYEQNNTAGDAKPLTFPFELTDASLHNGGDVDYYKVTVNASGVCHLSLEQPDSGEIYKLELLTYAPPEAVGAESKETLIATCALDGSQSITKYLETGDYYVRVSSKNGEAYSARPYSLKFCRQAQASLNLSEMNLLTYALSADSPYRYSDTGVNTGGHYLMSTAYFTSWQGPCEEFENPYPTEFDDSDNFLISYDYKKAGTPSYTEYQSLWLPNSQSLEPIEFRQVLKSALYCYGAMEVTYLSSRASASGSEGRYIYDPVNKTTNHDVTLVGWDDTISKENFTYTTEESVDGETITSTLQPEQDGAWIVKNSWGPIQGDEGYIYISYEDVSFCAVNNPTVHILDKMPESYDRQYTHSETGTSNAIGNAWKGAVVLGKNRFTAEGDEALKAVSFANASTDTLYEISVSKKASGEDVWSSPALVASGRLSYSGFYTIPLTGEISLNKGDQFEIIVRLEGDSDVGAALGIEYKYLGTYEVKDGDNINYSSNCAAAVFHENESFIFDDTEGWQDTVKDSAEPYNLDIRAYTDGGSKGYNAETGYEVVCSKTKEEIPENPLKNYFVNPNNEGKLDITGATPEKMANGVAGGSAAAVAALTDGIGVPENATVATLPAKFDLRDIGVESYVKNQGYIGSCWTFGSMASAEMTLMRRSYGNGLLYNISLPQSTGQANLDEVFFSYATITATDGSAPQMGYDIISWQFSGDLDAIEILNRQTRSGVEAPLFNAVSAGTVTLTATINGDMTRAVSMTVTLSEEEPPVFYPDPIEKYAITVVPVTGGSVSGVPSTAAQGDKVDVVVKPQEGYSVHGLIVRDDSGKPIEVIKLTMESFRFTMPKGKVTVTPILFKNPQPFANPYSDVRADSWYYDSVAFVTNNKLMTGIGGGKFAPGKASTRAEIWQLLYNMLAESESTAKQLSGTTWYSEAQNFIMGLGVTDGTSPDENVTREQLAVMLYRYAKSIGIDVSVGENTNILSYKDALSISEYAIPAMQWVCGAGLIQGDNGYLMPGGKAQRCQVAAILQRFCENILK